MCVGGGRMCEWGGRGREVGGAMSADFCCGTQVNTSPVLICDPVCDPLCCLKSDPVCDVCDLMCDWVCGLMCDQLACCYCLCPSGLGSRPFDCGGSPSKGPDSGPWDTVWNVGVRGGGGGRGTQCVTHGPHRVGHVHSSHMQIHAPARTHARTRMTCHSCSHSVW